MFKELLRVCPYHGLEKWLIVQTFYDGLTYNTRISIDVVTGGSLMNWSVDEAYDLNEDMAVNQNYWSSKHQATKNTLSWHEVSEITLFHAKIDAFARKMGQANVSMVEGN